MKARVRYTKHGKVRFTSHRDAARLWERAVRKSGLPIGFTEGFTPRPKISFGLALPTGAESIAEYLDLRFDDDVDLDELVGLLDAALPVGFGVVAAQVVEPGTASLQDGVSAVRWELFAPWLTNDDHAGAAERLLAADELLIERERKGERRLDDVRPVVCDLRPDEHRCRLIAELATVGRALRPAELAEIAYPHCDTTRHPHIAVRAVRTHQWIDDGDVRREVISLPDSITSLTPEVSA